MRQIWVQPKHLTAEAYSILRCQYCSGLPGDVLFIRRQSPYRRLRNPLQQPRLDTYSMDLEEVGNR